MTGPIVILSAKLRAGLVSHWYGLCRKRHASWRLNAKPLISQPYAGRSI